jgi:hypothetical protein
MGCDIHLAVEAIEYGTWRLAGAIEVDRNYALFAEMAGVRGGGSHSFSSPRGYPEDIHWATSEYLEQDAADHSRSWLTTTELLSITDTDYGPTRGIPLFPIIRAYCLAYGKKNVRVVFGFDS